MTTERLEAFSDGVLAIIITIMVLELRVPHDAELSALSPVAPVFASNVLSFVNVGIYWNNHHHLLHATERVNGAVMWANLHLLFWLSLVPFGTAWMGVKQRAHALLASAVGEDLKGKVSLTACASAIPLAFVNHWISDALFVAVAGMWFVPDPRISHALAVGHRRA